MSQPFQDPWLFPGFRLSRIESEQRRSISSASLHSAAIDSALTEGVVKEKAAHSFHSNNFFLCELGFCFLLVLHFTFLSASQKGRSHFVYVYVKDVDWRVSIEVNMLPLSWTAYRREESFFL